MGMGSDEGRPETVAAPTAPAAAGPEPGASVHALKNAIHASTLTPSQRMVLLAILYESTGHEATLSVGEMEHRTGLARSSIMRNVKALRAARWLRVEARKGPDGGKLCNTYVVTPAPPKARR
jgi:DNA-binding MarR family transcriptional regulator